MTWKLWIDGGWRESSGGESRSVENPATGEIIDQVTEATASDVDVAVRAADRAFRDGSWSGLTPGARSELLYRLAILLEKRGEEFARIETEETGKPYPSLSKDGDVDFSVDNLKFFAASARSWAGTAAGRFIEGHTSMVQRVPVGVVGQIAPWNYPLNMAVWKVGPALAAGCTVVLKPDARRAGRGSRHSPRGPERCDRR